MRPVRSARPDTSHARPAGTPPRPRTPLLSPRPEWEHHKIFKAPYYHDPLIRWETEQDEQDFDATPVRRPTGRRRPPS